MRSSTLQRNMLTKVAVGLLAVIVGRLASAEMWTDRTGKFSVQAEFIGVKDNSVVLRKLDGSDVTIAIDQLSADSRALAKQLSERQKSVGKSQPITDDKDSLPRNERWRLEFKPRDLDEYAQTLDHFRIELGVLGGPGRKGIDYAAKLSSSPKTRHGESEKEQRLYYMTTAPGTLDKFDRQLLEKAGVPLTGGTILKFISSDLEDLLAKVERDYAKSNDHQVGEILKTSFRVVKAEGKFQFEVRDQQYRAAQGD